MKKIMTNKRLTKKHYAIIESALELSLDDRTEEMQTLIAEIQDIVSMKTTNELYDKWNVSNHILDCNHPDHKDYDIYN